MIEGAGGGGRDNGTDHGPVAFPESARGRLAARLVRDSLAALARVANARIDGVHELVNGQVQFDSLGPATSGKQHARAEAGAWCTAHGACTGIGSVRRVTVCGSVSDASGSAMVSFKPTGQTSPIL